ncbi:MAG: hypothetical protein JW395_3966 [Nitrospira sp.]|nr:hypothetical protein [Nitrospira sp.]
MKSATPQVTLDANASKAPMRAGLPYPFVATVPLNILCRGPQLRFARRDKEEIAASIPIRTSAKMIATTITTPIKASTLIRPLVATSYGESRIMSSPSVQSAAFVRNSFPSLSQIPRLPQR